MSVPDLIVSVCLPRKTLLKPVIWPILLATGVVRIQRTCFLVCFGAVVIFCWMVPVECLLDNTSLPLEACLWFTSSVCFHRNESPLNSYTRSHIQILGMLGISQHICCVCYGVVVMFGECFLLNICLTTHHFNRVLPVKYHHQAYSGLFLPQFGVPPWLFFLPSSLKLCSGTRPQSEHIDTGKVLDDQLNQDLNNLRGHKSLSTLVLSWTEGSEGPARANPNQWQDLFLLSRWAFSNILLLTGKPIFD